MPTADELDYPPPDHVLRSLGLEIDVLSATEHDARMDPSDGVGALSTAVDVLAGMLCGRAVAPDWMATSSLQLHLWQAAERADHLSARMLRAGRTVVSVQVQVSRCVDSGREQVGTAIVTFARLPRRASNLSLGAEGSEPGARVRFDPPVHGPVTTFDRAVRCKVLDADGGVTSTALTPQVRNSFGALNGGVVAGVIDRSAHSAIGLAHTGSRTVALTVDYLGQATVGPVRSAAVLLDRDRSGAALVRVELRDTGRVDDTGQVRLMALGHVRVTPS